MKYVKFNADCGQFNAGEIASFPDDQVEKLVKAEVAEVVEIETEAPAKPSKKKTEETF